MLRNYANDVYKSMTYAPKVAPKSQSLVDDLHTQSAFRVRTAHRVEWIRRFAAHPSGALATLVRLSHDFVVLG